MKHKFFKPTAGKAAVALILSVIAFIVLITVQRSFIELPPTKTVLAAVTEIPAGTQITTENVNQYFATMSLNSDAAPKAAYIDAQEVIGKITCGDISRNETATQNRFIDTSGAQDIQNPVEVSVAAASSAYADGGRIRAGDSVNIGYILSGDEKQYIEILSSVYVTAALDTSGVSAANQNDGVIATQFSLLIPKADAETLYSQIERGNVVVQKVKKA